MTKIALAGFVGHDASGEVNVTRGDTFPDDHDIVKNDPQNFADSSDKPAVNEIKRQDKVAEIEVGALTAAADAKDEINSELAPGGLTSTAVAGAKK